MPVRAPGGFCEPIHGAFVGTHTFHTLPRTDWDRVAELIQARVLKGIQVPEDSRHISAGPGTVTLRAPSATGGRVVYESFLVVVQDILRQNHGLLTGKTY